MYQNELYHHGVKGMKWGHRKAAYGSTEYYRNKQQKAMNRYNSSKTRLGKAINSYSAYKNETKAGVRERINKESGLLKSYDNAYGHGKLAEQQKARANYYDRKETYALTRNGRRNASVNAYNNRNYSKANDKIHNSKSLIDFGKNYIDAASNTKIKTWSGRTTTNGKQAVDSILTGGTLTTLQDLVYYKDHKYDY